MTPRHTRTISAILGVSLTAALLPGCVERSLMLRSDPPGARVVLNGDFVGVTPTKVPFDTYGVFDVAMSAPHCARLRTEVPVSPPWWETIPLDFLVENLWPFTVHDDHDVLLTLKPLGSAEDAALEQRELELRARAQSGEPLPPSAGDK